MHQEMVQKDLQQTCHGKLQNSLAWNKSDQKNPSDQSMMVAHIPDLAHYQISLNKIVLE